MTEGSILRIAEMLGELVCPGLFGDPITSSVWSVSVEATPRRADKEWIRNRGLLRRSQQSELLYRVRLAESDFSPGNCES